MALRRVIASGLLFAALAAATGTATSASFDVGQRAPKDPATAYAWYRRAAEAGLARAQFNVAVMLDSGVGVVCDPAQAATWYAKVAAHGHGRA